MDNRIFGFKLKVLVVYLSFSITSVFFACEANAFTTQEERGALDFLYTFYSGSYDQGKNKNDMFNSTIDKQDTGHLTKAEQEEYELLSESDKVDYKKAWGDFDLVGIYYSCLELGVGAGLRSAGAISVTNWKEVSSHIVSTACISGALGHDKIKIDNFGRWVNNVMSDVKK